MKFARASRFAHALLLVSGLLLASLSQAQNPGNDTLEQIRNRGYILPGFQENAVPFVSTGDTTLEAAVDAAASRRDLTANFRNYPTSPMRCLGRLAERAKLSFSGKDEFNLSYYQHLPNRRIKIIFWED
jgi:hypothetical protein